MHSIAFHREECLNECGKCVDMCPINSTDALIKPMKTMVISDGWEDGGICGWKSDLRGVEGVI
jgi:ferredoxin